MVVNLMDLNDFVLMDIMALAGAPSASIARTCKRFNVLNTALAATMGVELAKVNRNEWHSQLFPPMDSTTEISKEQGLIIQKRVMERVQRTWWSLTAEEQTIFISPGYVSSSPVRFKELFPRCEISQSNAFVKWLAPKMYDSQPCGWIFFDDAKYRGEKDEWNGQNPQKKLLPILAIAPSVAAMTGQTTIIPNVFLEKTLGRRHTFASSIKDLYIIHRKYMSFLPSSFASLSRILTLDLRMNALKEIRPIPSLSTLRLLNLEDNEIESLPDEIGQLSELRELNISSNRLIALPASLLNLKLLWELKLRNNPKTSDVKSVWKKVQEHVADLLGLKKGIATDEQSMRTLRSLWDRACRIDCDDDVDRALRFPVRRRESQSCIEAPPAKVQKQ